MTIFAYLYIEPLLETATDGVFSGLKIDRIYQDFGQRQALTQLLADCEIQAPKCLLVRKLDELGNSLTQITTNLNLIESLGIEIITTEQDYHSSSLKQATTEEIRATLSQILQQISINQRSQSLQKGHARNRLKSLPPPGKAPYGYRRGKDRYIIDRSTAPVVKDFCERFLIFGSLRGAVRYLEKRYGKKISVSTGRRWLTNPVYRGDLTYQNHQTISDTHIPIISREEAAQIDRLLRRNRSLSPRTASANRSLAGLVICQTCQLQMTITRVMIKRKTKEYLYLRCLNCPEQPKCKAISYQQVLETTIERIGQDLPLAVSKINLHSLDEIKKGLTQAITAKQEIINQLPTLQAQGILDQETLSLRIYKLRNEISQLQSQLAQLPPVNLQAIAQTVTFKQFWLDLSESERRFYFREFIRQVEIIRIQGQVWQLQLVFIF